MEGWNALIQVFQELEDQSKAQAVEQFSVLLFSQKCINKDQAIESFQLGGLHSLISLKILLLFGHLPEFNQLILATQQNPYSKEIFKTSYSHYPEEFLEFFSANCYNLAFNIQEELLETIETIEYSAKNALNSIRASLDKVKRYSEENSDVSVNLHHKTACNILKKHGELSEKYFETFDFDQLPILSNELIHYISMIPKTLFSQKLKLRIQNELLHFDLYVRKNAASLLKKSQAFEAISVQWTSFWEIYESLENYNKTIVAALWKRVYALFDWDVSIVKLLFMRGKMHENLTLRRYIAKNYMKQAHTHEDFTVKEFILYLADPALYSDSIELIGKSNFGVLVTKFFVNFIKHCENPVNRARELIKNVFAHVEFQVGFRYFIEAFESIYTEDMLDFEILEQAYNVTVRQMTQLTPFQRHKAQLFLKKIIESPSAEFLVQKLRVAAKIPLVCNIKVENSEAFQLIEECIGRVVQSNPMPLSHKELGILFAISYSKESTRIITPLLTSLQSIYRNTYLKAETCKIWLTALYNIIKQLNKYNKESLQHYITQVIDEIFNYSLSVSDKELASLTAKTIMKCLLNIGLPQTFWALTKLSVLQDLIQKQPSTLYNNLLMIYHLLKFASKTSLTDFSQPSKSIIAFLTNINERSQVSRDTQNQVTVLKWKTLSIISQFDSLNLFSQALTQIDSCSQNMLESIFDIISNSASEGISAENMSIISNQAWHLVLETKNDAPLGILFSFVRLAFNKITIGLESTPKLFASVLKAGKERWGIVRILLHQCAPLWLQYPTFAANYIDCIYELSYFEESRSEDTDFLVSCLFALINEPKPHIKDELTSLRSQYIRIFILLITQKLSNQSNLMQALLLKCLTGLSESCLDRGEFPNSLIYKKKIRLGQLLCSLASWASSNCPITVLPEIVNKLIELLKIPYVHSARQYIERFLIRVMIDHPEYTSLIEVDYDLRPQLAGSHILILGSAMIFTLNENTRQQLFSQLLPFTISNTAHIRRVAHFIMIKLAKGYPEYISQSLIFKYLLHNKECQKMANRLDGLLLSFESLRECGLEFILTGSFSEFDEVIHKSIVNDVDELTKNLLETDYEINYADSWKNMTVEDISRSGGDNFQRKVEDTQALVELRTSKGVQRRHELIVVASLVDKIPNLAGITRTSEVFNLQMITVAYKNLLSESEFKSMAVTADKWLPIMEVGKADLEKFLRLQRQNRYQIVGLEQTANSVAIDKYKFVGKTVIVLGHEKDGIPSELLSLLDACLEIPQFGLIRSLNVHVSASICIWEYIKQLYL